MFEDEKVVETKTCKHCGVSFDITDKDLEFYEKISPVFPENKESCHSVPTSGSESLENKNFNSKKDPNPPVFGRTGRHGNLIKKLGNGKVKYLIPSPTLCPDCRQQRRLHFRNFFHLYTIKDSISGKKILSMYKPGRSFPIYTVDYWWSDNWDATDYALDFEKINFRKPFFSLLKKLHENIPRMNVLNINSENTTYSNGAAQSENCYLVFGCVNNENCLYGHIVWDSKKCLDCLYISRNEVCYMCVDCIDSFGLFYCIDCNNCQNCFACVGLENKSFCIYNKQYSREDYEEKVKNILFDKKKFQSLFKNKIVKYYHGYNSENITGDYIYNSSNIRDSFDIKEAKDLKYCTTIGNFQDSMDSIYSPIKGELVYETVFANGYNILFSDNCVDNSSFIYYCNNCYSCKHCFACVGLKNKSYCILNKEYSKEQYEKLVPKIIEYMIKTGEWGEFFPTSLSPFCYNETMAQEYYPLEKKEALDKGLNWSDYEVPFPKVEKIIPASKLPENIKDIPDDILNWAIECEISKKPFRIIKEELDFYRKHNLPIPKKHPDERHKERMSLRNTRKLFKRNCDKCGIAIQTSYAPERPEKVYCEKCYNGEVY